MSRLNQLIKHHNAGSINESDYHEMSNLLIKMVVDQGEMVEFYGNQLMTIKAENALLKQQLHIRKVN